MIRILVTWLFIPLFVGGSLPAVAHTFEFSRQQIVQQLDGLEAKDTPTAGGKETYSKAQLLRRSEDAKKYYKLAVKFGRANLFKQAAELFLRAIHLKPDYTEAYLGLADAYFSLGRWEDSITAYEKVVGANPKDKKASAALAAARGKLGIDSSSVKPQEPSAVGEKINLNLSAKDDASSTAATAPLANKTSPLDVYKVGVGDVLEIRFRDVPANRPTLFTVTANGLLEYPFLEQPLTVIGFTAEDISRQLKGKLRLGSASEDADIFVAVREYSSHIVLVSGLVKEPGPKILRREAIPLYVALADAQVLPEAEEVTVVFRHENQPLSIGLAEARTSTVLIRPGDVITVQAAPKQYFFVAGEVKQPGEKLFRTGLTLTQAILAAGGVTENGKKIELRRQQASGLLATTSYKMKDINSGKSPDVAIQAGDRIIVVH